MKKNKGFTLVELIVVLVILAILAALLIPALLGYIDRAREKKNLLNAKNALTAIQAGLSEQYALHGSTLKTGNKEENYIVPSKNKAGTNKNGDVNATGTVQKPNSFSDMVLETIDKKDRKKSQTNNINDINDPVVLIFGVGSNLSGSTCTAHEKYTVYYIMYQETVDSTPLFYFNGVWTTTNPITDKSQFSDRHTPKVGALAGKKIQYYCISNKLQEKYSSSVKTAFDDNFWKYVESFK